MTTGTLAFGKCYGTQGAAVRAYCEQFSMQASEGAAGSSTCSPVSLGSSIGGGQVSIVWKQDMPAGGYVANTQVLHRCVLPDTASASLEHADVVLLFAAVVTVFCGAVAVKASRLAL